MAENKEQEKKGILISLDDFRSLQQLSDSGSLDMSFGPAVGAAMAIGQINSIRELLTKYLPDFLELEEKS